MESYEYFKGNDEPFNLTFVDEDGAIIDITNYTIKFSLKKPFDDEVLIYKDSTDSDEIEKTDAEEGEATLYINSTDTDNLDPGMHDYDIKIVDGSGNERTYEKGFMQIKGAVTIA